MSVDNENKSEKLKEKIIYTKSILDNKKTMKKNFKISETLDLKVKLPLIPLPHRKTPKNNLTENYLNKIDESTFNHSNDNLKTNKIHFLKKNFSLQNLIKSNSKKLLNEKETEDNNLKSYMSINQSNKKIKLLNKRNNSFTNIHNETDLKNLYKKKSLINKTNIHLTPKKHKEYITKTEIMSKPKTKSVLLVNRIIKMNKIINQKTVYYSDSKNGLIIENNEMSQKINQDRLLVIQDILGIKNFSIFCVFDGHGNNGHFISSFIQIYISQYFKDSTHFYFPKNNKNENKKLSSLKHFNITTNDIYSLIKKDNYSFIYKMINSLIKELNNSNYDLNESGSTYCQLIQCGKKLICINIGDSKSILINKNEIISLSKEHKLNILEEKERIEKLGGEILKINSNGPFRVFEKGKNYPGLSMSRSIGDLIAKKLGVISEPEIIENEINCDSLGCVIGSDGIWEFLSNDKVAEVLSDCYNSFNGEKICALKLSELSRKEFLRNNQNVDDTSVIVILFK